MTEPTPPPEEQLPDQTRARIRADLMAATQAGPSGRRRRWAVPAAAAASVVLVAGLTAWALGSGGDPTGAGPATSGSATPAPSQVPSASLPDLPFTPPAVSPTPGDSSVPTELPTLPPTVIGADTCAAELAYVLKGADLAAMFPDKRGNTSYWVKGSRFSLCDERAGATTVHQPLPLEPDLHDVATWRVSSLFPPTKDGYRTIRVAGGLVPEGMEDVFTVSYTFPDGHTERSTNTVDDQGRSWWRVLYAYDDGGGNELDQPPIEVTYSLSGVQESFTLEWAVDTCAQANHGC